MPDSAPVTRHGNRPSLTNRTLRALLRRLDACPEALEWLDQRNGPTAWAECERGDWLLWITARLGVERPVLVRATVACVQPAVTAYVPAGEMRPQAALDAALRWADDPTPANLERVRIAQYAAYAAFDAAFAVGDAAFAAFAAADTADAAYAAVAAADAADAVGDAADAAAAADARHDARLRSLRESAQIVRSLIPFAVVLAALEVAP